MTFDYAPVNIKDIPNGLNLECKVYFKKDEELLFLCEDVVVTPALLERLKKIIEPDNSVYIASNYIEEYRKRGIELGWKPPNIQIPPVTVVNTAPAKPTMFDLVKEKYDESKVETQSLLEEISVTQTVNEDKTEDVTQNIQFKLETNDISMIIQSINNIRGVDEYLHTHSLNVAFLNGLMGKWLKYDKARQDELVKIGLLHDIGKLKVPAEILNKPAGLTKEEFQEIKKHSYYSFEILVNSGFKNKAVLLGIIQHHEKLNGTGYPYGISSEKITDYARITSISDIYDAMVAKRVYKDAHSPFAILENFSKEGYSELDINYVKIFIDCMIEELKGKLVNLSDGSVAKVVMINERRLMYPMVEVNGKIIATSPELHCVSMFNRDLSAEETAKTK